MTGAQVVLECLKQEGVSVVFGYPGATIAPFYDALAQDGSIRHILVRQEQNAGHAASGYSRASGKVGVCCTTSGPGATNLITGLATAYMDSIPMVALTGQVRSDLLGRDVFQEADITGACEPFTKHSYLATDTQELPTIIKEAFHIAATGRPGPVLIDLPQDTLEREFQGDFVYPDSVDIIGYKPRTKGHPLQMKRALEAIGQAERPVICAGGGVVSAQSRRELLKFAEKLDIPVVSTLMGVGMMPTEHPLYMGMLGTHGIYSANYAIHHADLVILCGARVGDRAMSRPDQIAQKAQIIHIDIDPAEIGKNMKADIPIVGDIRLVLRSITEKCDEMHHDGWISDLKERIPLTFRNAVGHGVQDRREDRDALLRQAHLGVIGLGLQPRDELFEVGHRAGRDLDVLAAENGGQFRLLHHRGVVLGRRRRCLRRDPRGVKFNSHNWCSFLP